jgi:hypothetical protein
MFSLWNNSRPIDLVSLTQVFLDRDQLDQIGGASILADLQSFLPTSLNIGYYVDILQEKFSARQLVALRDQLSREIECSKINIESVTESALIALKRIQTPQGGKRLPNLDDMAHLLENMPEVPTELVKGVLHRGSKLIIGGTSKGRKTFSLMDLGISVATGEEWWGCPTVKGKVCYINFEIQRAFFAKRYADICWKKQVRPAEGMFMSWTLRGLVEGIEKMAADIIKTLMQHEFSLIIFDPIYKALGDRDENKAGDVASMLNELEAIAVKTGAAIAFGAHFSKGNQAGKESIDRIGGSGVFARDPDSILTMTANSQEECFTISSTLRNFQPQPDFVVRWEWPLFQRDEAVDPLDLKQSATKPLGSSYYKEKHTSDDIIDSLLECGNSRKPSELQKYLSENSGMSTASFWRLWKKAKDSPFVTMDNNRFIHVNNLKN